jgi:hypothetical protein
MSQHKEVAHVAACATSHTRRWRFSFAFLVGFLIVGLMGATQANANVYWNNYNQGEGNTIGRALADGSAVNQTFVTTAGVPLAVTSDGHYVTGASTPVTTA